MSVTTTDFVELVRARLREANNSRLGEMQTGVGGAATVSAADRIEELGQRIAEEICRSCFYHYLKASSAISTPVVAGTSRVELASLYYESGARSTIWRPEAVNWNGYPLREVEQGCLRRDNRLGQWGTPTKFYLSGEGWIGLDAVPNVDAPLTVAGAAVPPAPSGGTPSWGFMPDEVISSMMVAGTCYLLTLSYADDEAIVVKGAAWKREYDAERMRRWQLLDPTLRERLFPSPPIPMQQRGR